MVQETQVYKVAEVQVSYKPDYNITERPKIKLTKRLVECGKLPDIIVWDHIILSE